MSRRHPGTRGPRVRGRRPPTQDGLSRLLILCEAARTEPGYFRALARDLNLPNVSVRTPKRGQWGPGGISTAAEQEGERDSDLDEIWCVLDHDERDADIEGFCSWLARQPDGETGNVTVRAAISVPCFEYWLLLHFRYTNRPFRGTLGGPSACEQVIRELEGHLDGYRKADATTYERCRGLLPNAIRNAKRAGRSKMSSSTNVWELVGRLRELAEMRRQRP